jgi:hypothetical protein
MRDGQLPDRKDESASRLGCLESLAFAPIAGRQRLACQAASPYLSCSQDSIAASWFIAIVQSNYIDNTIVQNNGSPMALSKRKTTIAVLRGILGPIYGREARFARLARRSVSWVKKVSAGVIPLNEKTARLVELETGVALDWLMGTPDAPPVNGRGNPYTSADFEWHRAGAKAGSPRIRSIGFPFMYALKIAGIGSAAGENGKVSLFLWRLRTFLDECAQEFGFDENARSFAESELQKVPRMARMAFHDRGFDFADLHDRRVVRAIKKAVKGKAPGEQVKLKVALAPEREKKRRKR